MPYFHRYMLAAILSLALLVACAAPPPPPDLSGWHILYARKGGPAGATLDLRAAGDLMLARHVGTLAAREGAAAIFAPTATLLAGDLALANLESPLSAQHDTARPGPYRLIAAPALAPELRAAGLDALGLANNHALDAGPAGLAESLAVLRAAGLAPVGAGPNASAAFAPVVLTAQGLRVAVLALNDVADPGALGVSLAPADDLAWRNPDFAACPALAEACEHGRAWLSAAALAAVQAARAEADLVVVLAHWGVEYAATPSARQRAWAVRLVAAGADLVLGAHPHVIQPAEPLQAGGRAGFVAYSLGNFVFDGPADPALSSGAVLRVLLDREGVALVAAAPLATAGGRPQPLDLASPAGRAALAALGAPGAELPATTPAPVAAAALSAWRWDGSAGQPVAPPAGLSLPAPPTRLPVDLRGDGRPLWAELDAAGLVTLRDGPAPAAPIVWRNEDPAWRFTRMLAGDPNDDGRAELLLLLWQPDAAGDLQSQPYLLGWRGGRYRIIWGGSATATPIQDLTLADLDGDGRGELVVLEGGQAPGDPGEQVSVWRWHGWGFQLEWRSPPGRWRAVGLHTPAGEQYPWLVAAP